MEILDIHTHTPRPGALVCADPACFSPEPCLAYSLAVHPWDAADSTLFDRVELLATDPAVLALGETGADLSAEVPLFRQLLLFRRHIELSEKLRKPLVIHDVKAHETVLGLKSELRPRQNWAIHGFRYKPSVARMLLDKGCYLSFGEKFNPDALLATPDDRILAETDKSPLPILEIINALSLVKGKDMVPIIAENSRRFLTPR